MSKERRIRKKLDFILGYSPTAAISPLKAGKDYSAEKDKILKAPFKKEPHNWRRSVDQGRKNILKLPKLFADAQSDLKSCSLASLAAYDGNLTWIRQKQIVESMGKKYSHEESEFDMRGRER